jgi:hypothetical protein
MWSNRATISSRAAIFAAASTVGASSGAAGTVLLVAGVAAARRGIGPRATSADDTVAGLGTLGFGGALAYLTVHDG